MIYITYNTGYVILTMQYSTHNTVFTTELEAWTERKHCFPFRIMNIYGVILLSYEKM